MSQNPNPNNETQGRVPPQAVQVEESVLGAMLIENEAAGTAVQMLGSDDFYKPAHRHIFEALVELYDASAPLDLLSVEEALRDKSLLDTCGGSGYLSELTRSVSSAANIDYHAQILEEKSLKRKLIKNSTEIINDAYRSDTDVYDVLDKAGQAVDSLTLGQTHGHGMTLSESLPSALDAIDAARNNPSHITGVASGLDIDGWTSGWQPGDLIVIASRPSMGKTGSLITMGRNMVTHSDPAHRTGVLSFSLEMPRLQYVNRVLAQESKLENENFRSGKVQDDQFEDLCTRIAPKLHDKDRTATWMIDDTPGLSLRVLRSKVRSYIRKYPDIGIIMIDYLQLMNAHASEGDTYSQKIGAITRGLKNLAKELEKPIILFSQLSRAVEKRGGDKRPQLSDLRESGDIEQDADIVIFIYRPEYYDITSDINGQRYPKNYAEFIISKQRNGPVGICPLHFKKEQALFANRADSWAEDTLEPDEEKPQRPQGKQMDLPNTNDKEPF